MIASEHRMLEIDWNLDIANQYSFYLGIRQIDILLLNVLSQV